MTELQSAHVKRIITNIVCIVGPLIAGLEAVRGGLPTWAAVGVTALSVALKSYQSLLDLRAAGKT